MRGRENEDVNKIKAKMSASFGFGTLVLKRFSERVVQWQSLDFSWINFTSTKFRWIKCNEAFSKQNTYAKQFAICHFIKKCLFQIFIIFYGTTSKLMLLNIWSKILQAALWDSHNFATITLFTHYFHVSQKWWVHLGSFLLNFYFRWVMS